MTAGRTNHTLFASACDHDWKYCEDWEGDPGVVNGTQTIRWLECVICGATKEADYDDVPDYSADYYLYLDREPWTRGN